MLHLERKCSDSLVASAERDASIARRRPLHRVVGGRCACCVQNNPAVCLSSDDEVRPQSAHGVFRGDSEGDRRRRPRDARQDLAGDDRDVQGGLRTAPSRAERDDRQRSRRGAEGGESVHRQRRHGRTAHALSARARDGRPEHVRARMQRDARNARASRRGRVRATAVRPPLRREEARRGRHLEAHRRDEQVKMRGDVEGMGASS